MVETIAIEKITLYDLERRFNLQLVEDPTFFGNGRLICPF